MLTETRGTIVMNSIAGEYIPYQGEIPQRPFGRADLRSPGQYGRCMRSTAFQETRHSVRFRMASKSTRGMIIGEHSRDNDLDVNCVREKEADEHARFGFLTMPVRLVPYKTADSGAVD